MNTPLRSLACRSLQCELARRSVRASMAMSFGSKSEALMSDFVDKLSECVVDRAWLFANNVLRFEGDGGAYLGSEESIMFTVEGGE